MRYAAVAIVVLAKPTLIAGLVKYLLERTRDGGRVHLALWDAGFDVERLVALEVAPGALDSDRTGVKRTASLC
jgi:hypothetical protein